MSLAGIAKLRRIVNSATDRKRQELEQYYLTDIARLCDAKRDYIDKAFEFVLQRLEEKNHQVKLSCQEPDLPSYFLGSRLGPVPTGLYTDWVRVAFAGCHCYLHTPT